MNGKTTVTFTIAEKEKTSIASGKLEVRRALNAEHLEWQFDSPYLAWGQRFETGVNLILNGGEQAACLNED